MISALIGQGFWHSLAAWHGLFAFVLLVAFVWSFEAILNLNPVSLRRLKIGTLLMPIVSFLTIFLGTWLYIGYRSPDNARAWLLENAPLVHKFGMEFKEFIALFSLPLAVVAAYIVWTFGEDLIEHPRARNAVFVCVLLAFLCTMTAFGLGALITKTKAVG